MSAFSRDKGKRGELDVARAISELTGWEVKRRVRQHDGDSDLEGVPGWTVEVKNCATLSIPAWWRQAVAQAGEASLPVLFYKIPRKGWRALWPMSAMLAQDEALWTDLAFTCDTTIDAWAALAREIVGLETEIALDLKAEVQQLGYRLN